MLKKKHEFEMLRYLFYHTFNKYLLRVEFIQLCFVSMFSPQTEDFCLGTISHVNKFFVPPSVTYGTSYTAQDQAIITHL